MKTPENLFRESFDGFEKKPPEKAWRNIQRRLMLRDFLRFSPKKFNVWYLTAFLAAGGFCLFGSDGGAEKSGDSILAVQNSGVSRLSVDQHPLKTEDTLPLQTPPEIRFNDIIESPLVSKRTGTGGENSSNVHNPDTQRIVVKERNGMESFDFTSYFKMSASEGCVPFTVEFKNLSKNTEYCYWNFGNGEVSYDNDGTTVYTSPGEYYVTLKTVNGTFSKIYTDTVRVYEQPCAQIAYVVSGKTLVAEARNSRASSFVWDFGDRQKSVGEKTTHTYSDFGKYRIKLLISNNICSDTLSAGIEISPQKYSIKFPNALVENTEFLPGGDVDKILRYSLKILNRNGKEVFFTSDPYQGWDGCYKGEKLPKGVYVYNCRYEFFNGERGNLTGNITVLRE